MSIQEGHIRGGDLHAVEQGGSFFWFDAAVQHHLANFGDGRLDGGRVSELREVDVRGRDGVGVVDVDRRRAHGLVKVAKPLSVESGRLAWISVGLSLFAKFDGRLVGRR